MNAGEIDREAADWIARRDADPSVETEGEFQAWLEADVRRRVTYLRLNAAWEHSQIAERLRPLEGNVDKDLFRPSRRMPWRRFLTPLKAEERYGPAGASRWRPRLAFAAAVLIAVSGTVALWTLHGSDWDSYSTSIGAFERIRLNDGSTVELNTNSAIRVRLIDTHRAVELRKGEARFVVARDVARPFDVVASGKRVRAVGTAFLVRVRDGHQIDVLVTEGRVLLDPVEIETPQGRSRAASESPTLLSAGQIAVVSPDSKQVQALAQTAIDRRLAWTQGNLIFQDEALVDAVAEFNRYSTRKLVIRDSSVSSLRVGGTFEATDTRSFLAALERVFGVPQGAVEEVD